MGGELRVPTIEEMKDWCRISRMLMGARWIKEDTRLEQATVIIESEIYREQNAEEINAKNGRVG